MIQLRHYLLVVPLQLKHFLVLAVRQLQHLILLQLYLLLQVHIRCGCTHEHFSQIFRKKHVHDVYLFDDDAVGLELFAHLVANLLSHLGLDITNPVDLDFLDEVTNMLFALFLKQLFESVWTEVVEELDDVIFGVISRSTDMEVDSNAEGHMHIILCRNVVYWALETDCVFGDHGRDSSVAAVRPLWTWFRYARIAPTRLL